MLPFEPHDAAFNRVNALYLAHAAEIAYLRAPSNAADERLGLDAKPFFNQLTRTRGFLGVCETHAVLAFRGTNPTTLPNWLTDVVVKLVTTSDYDGRVHHGFNSALRQSWKHLERQIARIGDRPLYLTGHSLGGALAVLAACRLAKDGLAPRAIYTFGSPRVGDRAFCAGYRLPTYRIVNRLDLVPQMPLASVKRLLPDKLRLTNEKILGALKRMAAKFPCYGHVRTLVYIDAGGTIHLDANHEPWTASAVAKAISMRGQAFVDGVSDHLISNYIRGLETGEIREADRPARRRSAT